MSKTALSRKKTLIILGVLSLALIVWDVFLATDGVPETTISAVLLYVSQHPILPFLCGVLAGHLFWPQYLDNPPPRV